LVRDDAGRLWIGSLSHGLSRVDDPTAPQPRFITLTTRDGLASAYAAPLTTDGVGRVYCATEGGLDRYDPATGRFRHFTTAD
jgi:ligand-binding sensor domain-containing protein